LTSSSSARRSTKPIHVIDVRELGDVEGCYEAGPSKFGFGISTSFKDNKLLIGSLKDFVYFLDYSNEIITTSTIPLPASESIFEEKNSSFGQSVFVGSQALFVSALTSDNGKGKVFVYPFNSNSKTNDQDTDDWSSFYSVKPDNLIENSFFGYNISENDNKVVISTFNQSSIYIFNKKGIDKIELFDNIKNESLNSDSYFGRNVILKNDILFTDAYYTDEFFIYDLNSVNRGFSSFSTAGQILSINSKLECSGGLAGGQFPCNEIDLMSFMDKTQIGGSNSTSLNDIWGWTDPQTNKEYALVGMSNGTSFVDISDAEPTTPHGEI
jgi:hypothetical protein